MKAAIGLLVTLLLVGCSREEPRDEPTNAGASAVAPTAGPGSKETKGLSTEAQPSAHVSTFTTNRLDTCRLVEKNEEEGGYYRHRCPGVGGFSYEHVESDLRQDLVIVGPRGERDELALNRIGGGGFSTLAPTFDWRGPAGAPPRTLTVRFNINESPEPNVPPRSHLMVIRLAAPACVIGVAAPGRDQSNEARAVADRAVLPDCVKR